MILQARLRANVKFHVNSAACQFRGADFCNYHLRAAGDAHELGEALTPRIRQIARSVFAICCGTGTHRMRPAFRNRVQAMGIEGMVIAPRSPWRNPYVERLIGSIRCEYLDHIIIFNDRRFRRVCRCIFTIIMGWSEHVFRSPRVVWNRTAYRLSVGEIIAFSEVRTASSPTNVAPHDLLWRPNRRTRFGVGPFSFYTVSLGCNGVQNPCTVSRSEQRLRVNSTRLGSVFS